MLLRACPGRHGQKLGAVLRQSLAIPCGVKESDQLFTALHCTALHCTALRWQSPFFGPIHGEPSSPAAATQPPRLAPGASFAPYIPDARSRHRQKQRCHSSGNNASRRSSSSNQDNGKHRECDREECKNTGQRKRRFRIPNVAVSSVLGHALPKIPFGQFVAIGPALTCPTFNRRRNFRPSSPRVPARTLCHVQ